jgi:hypothetical protein
VRVVDQEDARWSIGEVAAAMSASGGEAERIALGNGERVASVLELVFQRAGETRPT